MLSRRGSRSPVQLGCSARTRPHRLSKHQVVHLAHLGRDHPRIERMQLPDVAQLLHDGPENGAQLPTHGAQLACGGRARSGSSSRRSAWAASRGHWAASWLLGAGRQTCNSQRRARLQLADAQRRRPLVACVSFVRQLLFLLLFLICTVHRRGAQCVCHRCSPNALSRPRPHVPTLAVGGRAKFPPPNCLTCHILEVLVIVFKIRPAALGAPAPTATASCLHPCPTATGCALAPGHRAPCSSTLA